MSLSDVEKKWTASAIQQIPDRLKEVTEALHVIAHIMVSLGGEERVGIDRNRKYKKAVYECLKQLGEDLEK